MRAFSLLYAVLQLLLPGAASIADARLEAASIRSHPIAHIESHGTPGCARVHPADCAFCRVISANAMPTAARAAVAASCGRIVLPNDAPAHVARLRLRATSVRAPPVVA